MITPMTHTLGRMVLTAEETTSDCLLARRAGRCQPRAASIAGLLSVVVVGIRL